MMTERRLEGIIPNQGQESLGATTPPQDITDLSFAFAGPTLKNIAERSGELLASTTTVVYIKSAISRGRHNTTSNGEEE